jgi:branched-chain amino acid transport system permease protein
MDLLSQSVVFGSVAALIGLGFALIQMVSGFPSLSIFGSYVVGFYATFCLGRLAGVSPYWGLPVAVVLGGAVSLAFYGLAVRPLQRMGADPVRLVLAGLGGLIAWGAFSQMLAYWLLVRVLSPVVDIAWVVQDRVSLSGVPRAVIVAVLTTLTVALALQAMKRRTRLGAAISACSEDPSLASVCGINPVRLQALCWLAAGAIGGLAGAFYPLALYRGPTSYGWLLAPAAVTAVAASRWGFLGALAAALAVAAASDLSFLALGSTGIFDFTDFCVLVSFVFLIALVFLKPKGFDGVYRDR